MSVNKAPLADTGNPPLATSAATDPAAFSPSPPGHPVQKVSDTQSLAGYENFQRCGGIVHVSTFFNPRRQLKHRDPAAAAIGRRVTLRTAESAATVGGVF